MTDAIIVGDRVTWQHKGETRTGTVISTARAWGDYITIQVDNGTTHRVNRHRLTRIETQEVSQ